MKKSHSSIFFFCFIIVVVVVLVVVEVVVVAGGEGRKDKYPFLFDNMKNYKKKTRKKKVEAGL